MQDNFRLQLAQAEWKKMFNSGGETFQRGITQEPALTETNSETNGPWGDELSEKSEGVFRVYAQNVNGFRLNGSEGNFDSFCEVLKEVQANVICGQEHNLDTTQSCVRSIVLATAQQHWNRSRVIFGTTPIPFVNRFKPGGTFQVTVNNGTSQIVNQTKDKWGRWVLQTFQGKEGQRVTIVTAYQVVTHVAPTGSITAATQQQSLLIHRHKIKSSNPEQHSAVIFSSV